MRLYEAFQKPESRINKVIMFVDMAGSTAMKEKTSEANWINTYGWFFDTLSEIIEEHGGAIVKYTGDGVMAVFDEDGAAEALNACIKIQEAIADGIQEKHVVCPCSTGLAAGEITQFDTPYGTDYIGSVVDLSARLCSGASPMAIFVDTETVSAAQMTKVKSHLGTAMRPKRKSDEYIGERQRMSAKGFAAPMEYHEILWGNQRYGVKSSALTEAVDSASSSAANGERGTGEAARRPERPIRGVVRRWDRERGQGFIVSPEDEFFYADGRFVVDPDQMDIGQKVFFIPRDPLIAGKNRVAACVCGLGNSLHGVVATMTTRGYGFIEVEDSIGNQLTMLMYVGDNPEGFSRGEKLAFTVSENDKGPVAQDPGRPE